MDLSMPRFNFGRVIYTSLTTLLNIFPILGPSKANITITTIATKTRINAYSRRPWPFSVGANNILITSFHNNLIHQGYAQSLMRNEDNEFVVIFAKIEQKMTALIKVYLYTLYGHAN